MNKPLASAEEATLGRVVADASASDSYSSDAIAIAPDVVAEMRLEIGRRVIHWR